MRDFKQLEIKEELKKAIGDLGFEEMTKIQEEAIPLLLDNKDVVGLSKTGSGKTIAFALPSIEKIDVFNNKPQILILSPTRELALQIEEVFDSLLKYEKITSICLYGGSRIDSQISKLKKGVQIVIGTPGRIMDHLRRKTLRIDHLKLVVLDEADEMLNMGFKEDVEEILKNTNEDKQVCLFSATMPNDIKKISKEFQKEPVTLQLYDEEDMSVKTIEQHYLNVKSGDKKQALLNLIYKHNPKSALVFSNTKKMVDDIVDHLKVKEIKVAGLHGDMSQSERSRVMNDFKHKKINILVASDVAARGIDVKNIEIIFNYDIPQTKEYYVHRIGRSGRAGKKGLAYTFVGNKRQLKEMLDIIKFTGSTCSEASLPTKEEILKASGNELISKIIKKLDKEEEKYDLSFIYNTLKNQGYNESDIVSAMAGMILNLDIKEVEKEHLSVKLNEKDLTGDKARLILFIGKKDGVKARNIVAALVEDIGLNANDIGRIDILEKFSFVDVPKEHAKEVVEGINNIKINKKKVKAEIKTSKKK